MATNPETPSTETSGQSCAACGFARWLLGNATNAWMVSLGLLALRLMTGVIFCFHGCQKGFGWFHGPGWPGTLGMVKNLGFPPAELWAAMLIFGELGGGLMLILGFATRLGGMLTAIVMIVALATVHVHNGFAEIHGQQMLLAASITLMLAGGGLLSLWPASGLKTHCG